MRREIFDAYQDGKHSLQFMLIRYARPCTYFEQIKRSWEVGLQEPSPMRGYPCAELPGAGEQSLAQVRGPSPLFSIAHPLLGSPWLRRLRLIGRIARGGLRATRCHRGYSLQEVVNTMEKHRIRRLLSFAESRSWASSVEPIRRAVLRGALRLTLSF